MIDIAIIGAGAAGCFTAANIDSKAGKSITIFEKTTKKLQKVKISGGGRCNVTHNCFETDIFSGNYPRGKSLLRKTLHHFDARDTINWFQERGVLIKAEADGRMFPVTDDSQTIIDCISTQLLKNNVSVLYNKAVSKVLPVNGGFKLICADNSAYETKKVLVSAGSFPKAAQYEWLEELGHTIIQPVPSLFTFNMPKHPVTELMGLSVPHAKVKVQGTKTEQEGPLLITHWGFSGPAVLKTSAWAAAYLHLCNYDFTIQASWNAAYTEEDIKAIFNDMRRENGARQVYTKPLLELPRRLWEYLLKESGIPEQQKWGDLPAAQQRKLIEKLLRDTYSIKGKTTFKDEFVTCGGIDLKEINSATMESKIHPGLYFAGEIMNVDGITGGFNFQHAWTSAFIAAGQLSK